MFRTLARYCLVASALLAWAVSAQAGPVDFDEIDVEFWIGDGENEAIVVVDWKSQTPGELYAKAFGFRWSGGDAPTGVDVLNALDAYVDGDTGRDPFYRLFSGQQFLVEALGWDANEDGEVDPANPDPDDWFESGLGFGTEPGFWQHSWWRPEDDAWFWDPVEVRITDPLIPGQLDGWSWDAEGPPPGDVTPDIPVRDEPVVPEPATCLLVGLGVVTLTCRTRRRFL